MGKEMFTDIFDLEIARKMSGGKSASISEILYQSLEKLVQKEFDAEQTVEVKMNPLVTKDDKLMDIKNDAVPVPTVPAPIQLDVPEANGIELKFQSETNNAQNLSKKPKAP
jgi:Rod binding domain-containing protein